MYATVNEIRAVSRNLETILSSPKGDIEWWGEEAKLVIDRFCGQDFSFEQRKTRVVRADDYILYFDKPISGDVELVSQTGGLVEDPTFTTNSDGSTTLRMGSYQIFPGKAYMLYHTSNLEFKPPRDPRLYRPDLLNITGDWGYATSKETLVVLLANELKEKYQSHRASGTFHQAIDVVNIVTSPDATDLDSAITLLNELKVDMSNHFLDLGFHCAIEAEAIDSPAATDLESAMILAEDMKHDFNLHIVNEPAHECMCLDTTNHVYGSTSNPTVPPAVKRIFIKLVQRISLRSNLDDQIQFNGPYESETTGDGYTYNMSNGTLRNLLRPEDRELLWPYVNHGRVII